MADSSSSLPVPPPSSQPASQSGSQGPPAPTSTDAPIAPKKEPDTNDSGGLDTSIAQETDVNGDNANTSTNMPTKGNSNEAEDPDAPMNPVSVDALAAASSPSKKETSLREFLGKMDEYAPIIPDAVTAHYLTLAGLPPPGNGPNQTPPHLARLLALATQKFIADIAADSYQYARIRASNSSSASNPMGSLNAASGLNMPAGAAGAGGAGAAAGASGDAGKGKANTHLGIQRAGFGGGGSGGSGQGRTVLTMEDLGMAASEYGVSVKRGEFYR
ncbi:hypothetical protein FE257_011520 [Aspergillus nanangensis]|uniref:Transcription initiation factor TFIID subunit 10 n=1 Tax=Aspergillus nanangensis TaxID=2582783 RepID=A0AAD4GRC3_ASPNN|nr:hypothetical protein FE257_011520 [Aspergillus nanangensis]